MSGQLDPYWVFGQNIFGTKFPAKDAWKLKENEGKQIESEADKDRLQKAEKQHKGQFLIHVPKSSSSSLIVDWDTRKKLGVYDKCNKSQIIIDVQLFSCVTVITKF